MYITGVRQTATRKGVMFNFSRNESKTTEKAVMKPPRTEPLRIRVEENEHITLSKLSVPQRGFYFGQNLKGGENLERIHELIKALNISDVITSTQFKVGGAIGGGLGTIINLLYGKANLIWISIYCWIIMLDWITGSKASKLDGTYSSQYGIEGITRTVVLLSLPVLAHLFDIALKLPDFFFFMVVGGLSYHILIVSQQTVHELAGENGFLHGY